jgi:DNA repair photolyase
MSILYTPKGRAREYAPLAVNHYGGCAHGCRYCYVPTIPPWKFSKTARQDFHACPKPRKDVVRKLRNDVRRNPGNGQRVMLSFTTDPYQPLDEEHCLTRQVIEVLHGGGYNVQVLTKGGSRALRDLDIFTERDAFATTMTLLSDEHSQKWEPGAALPADRIETIRKFHEAGIPTWVSLEPVLNPDSAIEIVRKTHAFVDLFKIGVLNHHALASRFDWQDFGLRAIELCESLNQHYLLKDDLIAHLPGEVPGPYRLTVADIEQWSMGRSQCRSTDAQVVHTQPSLFQNQ